MKRSHKKTAVSSSLAKGIAISPDARFKIWGAGKIVWFYMIFYILYGIIGISLLIAGASEKNGTAPLVTGIFITVMFVPLYAILIGNIVRPLVIERGVLKIPKTFGHREVSLSTLSGVGLVYRVVPRSSGWMLQIWGDDGKPMQIRRFTVTSMRGQKLAPGVKRRVGGVRDWTIPLPKENTKALGLTKSGNVATTIFESSLAVQGTDGPLVRSANQKTVVYDPNSLSKIFAWWSPDGYMGRARGLPGPDSAKLADPSQCDVAPIPSDVSLAGLSHAELFPATSYVISQSSNQVPLTSPEVQRARKRNVLMTFVSFPFFIAGAVAFTVLLARQGLLPSGEVCAAVVAPTPLHASMACNAWRHHQLITFVWIASILALGLVATIFFQVRAMKNLVRTSRAASVPPDAGNLLPKPWSPR